MTFYVKHGVNYQVTPDANLNIAKILPVGTYQVNYSMDKGYFLTEIDDFKVGGKRYGTIENRVDRIVNTFLSRSASTGVLLSGEKGSGKTLLAKDLSIELASKGIITIVISSPYSGDGLNSLLQSIDQPAMVMFDEFEKMYNDRENEQAPLLTLFDGIFTSKKLFVITCNDRHKLNDFFINRPGRFFYSFSYDGIDEAIINDYVDDNLVNKTHSNSVKSILKSIHHANFDMMKALIEEMNRYDEPAIESLKYLNINAQPASERWAIQDVTFRTRPNDYVSMIELYRDLNGGSTFRPALEGFSVAYDYTDTDNEESYMSVTVKSSDLKKIDGDVMIFENNDIYVSIKKVPEKQYDFRDFF